MERPTLIVQTVWLHAEDRKQAASLGADLYAHLTRPVDDRLAHGGGVMVLSAVAPDHVDLEAAEHVVLVPVLGPGSLQLARAAAIESLRDWHDRLGEGHVLALPTVASWRSAESE
jgi:hypothetical protein